MKMSTKDLDFAGKASWLELSASALRNNIQVFRDLSANRFLLGVVLKGNAYGHGLLEVLPVVHPLIDIVYVVSPIDAFQIRNLEKTLGLSQKRVLVIGPIALNEAVKCAQENIEAVISDFSWKESIPALRKKKLRIVGHLHLDTGLAREGFTYNQIESEIDFLKDAQDVISLKGVMSHFSNTEDVTEQQYANLQLSNFHEGKARLYQFLGIQSELEEHFAASAATLVLPNSHLSVVRVGISLYGFWPSAETRISAKFILQKLPIFEPVLSWKCESQIVKPISKGSYVGYGCTYRMNHDGRIAVFPVGYFDGYPRIVSGKAHVLIHGKRCPVIGRVMMNSIIVDVTYVTEQSSDYVCTLLGSDGDETISAESIANWSQTIQYEIVTRLGSHLKRVIVE